MPGPGPLIPTPRVLLLPAHSIVRGVNQDHFIQRAIEAANAYSSILQAVQAAEGAAGQARQQANDTWAVSPCPPSSTTRPWFPAGRYEPPPPMFADGGAAGPGAAGLGAADQHQCPAGGRPQGAAEAGPRSVLGSPVFGHTGRGAVVVTVGGWWLPCAGVLLTPRLGTSPWERCGAPPPTLALWPVPRAVGGPGRGFCSPDGSLVVEKRVPAAKGTRSAARSSGCWRPLGSGLALPSFPRVICGTGIITCVWGCSASPSRGPSCLDVSVCVCWPWLLLVRWAKVGCTVCWEWGLLGLRLPSPAVRVTLQGTGTQLRDAQARKEQQATRIQEVQAMLAMDTGRSALVLALGLCLSQVDAPPMGMVPARVLQWALRGDVLNTCTVQSGGQPQPREPVAGQETTRNSSKQQVKVVREQEVLWRESKVGLGGHRECAAGTFHPQRLGALGLMGLPGRTSKGGYSGWRAWHGGGGTEARVAGAEDPGKASGRGVMRPTQGDLHSCRLESRASPCAWMWGPWRGHWDR